MPKPIVHIGPGSTLRMANVIAQKKDAKILLVTDRDLVKLGLHKSSQDALEKAGAEVTVYAEISPNPSVEQIENGLKLAKQKQCNVVLAIGGGSPIDAAKVIATGLTNDKPIEKMAGLFKVKNALPPLYVVPTTAGTGTEGTIGAVITNTAERRKLTIADPKLVPLATALDAELMKGLPPSVTAMTGLDALTHAIETYLSKLSNENTQRYSTLAIKLIFDNLPEAYTNGQNMTARENMSLGAFYAGLAINQAALGYVHAIAHQLGGYYNVPHGLANAEILPQVLDFSMPAINPELAKLYQIIKPSDDSLSESEQANAFVVAVRELIKTVNIPSSLDMLKPDHYEDISQRAIKEAFGLYAVPTYMTTSQCQDILKKISTNA